MPYKGGKFTKPGDKLGDKKKSKQGDDKKDEKPPKKGMTKPVTKEDGPESGPNPTMDADGPTPEQGEAVQHVNETHPGETQPHPTTGVHAFHVHHVGEGQYRSHAHLADGQVETQDHPDANSVREAADQAFPPDQQEVPADYAMGGIGGGDGNQDSTDY